jgi:hypothetical protein
MVRSSLLARAVCALLVSLALAGASAAREPDYRPSVYAFLHTETKSATLAKSLQDKLPGLTVTVFGRYRDFEEAMASRRPDAVIALQPLIGAQRLPVLLQGVRGDHDWEPYVLLTTGATDGTLSGKLIGVVDVLGRDGTQEFVTKLLKTPDVKLKRVTKMEDLLPLLQFSVADSVLVPATLVKGIVERSRLPLRVRELPDARVGLPAVGIVNASAREVVLQQIQRLDGDTNRSLGVDRWRGK